MQLAETVQQEARQRIVLCDLNWVRLLYVRLALAQFFDHPATHHHLKAFRRVEVDYAPGFRSTALLLVGWLAGQLGWERAAANSPDLWLRKNDNSRELQVSLTEKKGEPISACRIRTDLAEFKVEHRRGADLLDVFFGRAGGRKMQQLLPAAKNDIVSLLSDELMRCGPHRVYLRAVSKVRELM
jgi:glucose-6-phosphate dehydrogenase assembly protein OpcA